MNELEAGRMERNPGDSPLRRLVRTVLAIDNDRIAERGKLDPYLVLQSRDERNP